MEQTFQNTKPFLRGHFHQAAFFGALGACSVLIAVANSAPVVRVSALIYGFTLLALFGVSSLYHRATWQPRTRIWLRRLDHGIIYVFMAGSATPIFLLGVGGDLGTRLAFIIWSAAALGVCKEMFWVDSPRLLTACLYLGVGWVVVPYLPEIALALGIQKLWFILGGGVIYTAGALIYALKRPNPFPKIFGYHEIFHALVVVASIMHFIVIYQLVRT